MSSYDPTSAPSNPCGCPDPGDPVPTGPSAPAPSAPIYEDDILEFIDAAFSSDMSHTEMPPALEKLIQDTSLHVALSGASVTYRRQVELIGEEKSATRRIGLGRHDLPNQSRTHKHSNFDYRFETRSAAEVAYVDLTHPTINDFIATAQRCAEIAATAAVVSAIYAGNIGAGMAIFVPAFKLCMYQSLPRTIVDNISITLGHDTETGPWTYH